MTRVPKADGGIEFRAPADVVTPIHRFDRDRPDRDGIRIPFMLGLISKVTPV